MARTTGPQRQITTNQAPEIFGGFDLSLTAAGITFIDSKGDVRYSTTISVKSKGAQRLSEICNTIKRLCERLRPKLVCIEGYANNAKWGREAAGELGGVVRLALHEMNIPFYIVPPNSLKLFVTGKGNAEKDMMILHVYKNWGISVKNNDEGDSTSLAKVAQCIGETQIQHSWTKTQIEVVEVITLPEDEKRANKKAAKTAKEERKQTRMSKGLL